MDKLREKFEPWAEDYGFDIKRNGDTYKSVDTHYAWRGYQAAYAKAISEFEQVGTVDCSDVNDYSIEFWGELDGSFNYALGTPLYTRKD